MSKHPVADYVANNATRNFPQSVIAAIDAFARTHHGMIHLGCEKGTIFDRIVRQANARNVLELGTNLGYSAIRLASNLHPRGQVHTVELDASLANTASWIIDYAGLTDKVTLICGSARQVISKFTEPFDLIFIDHLPQNYLADLNLLEERKLIHEGSVVISDNVVIFEHELSGYLRHLRTGGGYDSALHQPRAHSDGMEVSTRITALV